MVRVNFIETAKRSPDRYSQLTVHNQPDGTVVPRGDNGKYTSRMHGDDIGHIDYFEAQKDNIDVYCKLYLEFQL